MVVFYLQYLKFTLSCKVKDIKIYAVNMQIIQSYSYLSITKLSYHHEIMPASIRPCTFPL